MVQMSCWLSIIDDIFFTSAVFVFEPGGNPLMLHTENLRPEAQDLTLTHANLYRNHILFIYTTKRCTRAFLKDNPKTEDFPITF